MSKQGSGYRIPESRHDCSLDWLLKAALSRLSCGALSRLAYSPLSRLAHEADGCLGIAPAGARMALRSESGLDMSKGTRHM